MARPPVTLPRLELPSIPDVWAGREPITRVAPALAITSAPVAPAAVAQEAPAPAAAPTRAPLQARADHFPRPGIPRT